MPWHSSHEPREMKSRGTIAASVDNALDVRNKRARGVFARMRREHDAEPNIPLIIRLGIWARLNFFLFGLNPIKDIILSSEWDEIDIFQPN